MSNVVLSDALATQLQNVSHAVNLCDASGKKFGYFVPIAEPSKYELARPEPSREELKRIEQTTEWYSTEEVLSHLETLK